MFCPKCGTPCEDDAKFCPKCGMPTDGTPVAKPIKEKKHPVLTAVLIVLGILSFIGIMASITGSDEPKKVNSTDTTTQATEDSTPTAKDSTPTAEATESVFTVGDAVELNDIVVTLVSVSENDGGNYMTPSDGMKFLVCEFEIENNSKKDIAVSSMLSFESYLDDYSKSMSLSAMLSTEKPQLDGTVAAGKKMNGVIGYEVDPEWKTIEIRFTPDFWAGKDIIFTYSK